MGDLVNEGDENCGIIIIGKCKWKIVFIDLCFIFDVEIYTFHGAVAQVVERSLSM